MRAIHDPGHRANRRGISPIWGAVGLIGVLIVGLLSHSLTHEFVRAPQPGEPAPGFQLTSLDGARLSLDDYRGKVVVLNFFASWCTPCRDEARDLEQTWRKVQNQEVQFLGIAYKETSKVRDFLDEFQITYPCALDPRSWTARAYGVTGVPETFVVDPEGRLVHHFIGPITEPELSLLLEQVLNRSSLP